jgi:DNA mismatch repair ATPase MutS
MDKFFNKWNRVKRRHPERIVLIHAGGLYTAFDEDAEKLHTLLDMKLYTKVKEGAEYKCFCHFISPNLDGVLSKLLSKGEKLCTTDM